MLSVAARATVMYAYALVLIRLTGKREMGQLSIPDAVAIFIVGDMFDDILWAEASMAKGVVGIGTILLLHLLVSFGIYRWRWFDRLVESGPTPMLRDGAMLPNGLRAEHLRQEGVEWELRQKGEESAGEVKEAYQEPADTLSLIKRDESKAAQMRDLSRLEALFR